MRRSSRTATSRTWLEGLDGMLMTKVDDNRKSAKRTALVIGLVALAVYVAFLATGFFGAL